jgi:hypothetical protein
MPEPYAEMLATVASGPDTAAEVLVVLEPTLVELERQAALALERAPTGMR